MADSNVKKVIISKSDLGKAGNNNEYVVRYRIVSEDKNRTSHWSPFYTVTGIAPIQVAGDVQVSSNVITAVWGDEAQRPAYDIFVNFDNNGFYYHGTSAVHSYSFLKTGTVSVAVKIQVDGINKTLSSSLEIYSSGTRSLV